MDNPQESDQKFPATHQIGVFDTLKEAWEKIHGFKGTAICYFFVTILVGIAITALTVFVMVMINLLFHGTMFPHFDMISNTLSESMRQVGGGYVSYQQVAVTGENLPHPEPSTAYMVIAATAQVLLQFVAAIINLFIMSSLVIQAIRNVCNGSGSISRLFSDLTHPWRLLGAAFIFAAGVSILELLHIGILTVFGQGLIAGLLSLALFVATVWLFIRFVFIFPLILEKHQEVVQTFKQSFIGTRGHAGKIFLTLLFYLLIYLGTIFILFGLALILGMLTGLHVVFIVLAAIAFVVALVWIYPWFWNIYAIFYRNLFGASFEE